MKDLEKYGEDIRIYNHYTDKHRFLKLRTLCDLFNDMAEKHTFRQQVDVATLGKSGYTWMLRRIHVFIPDMPRCDEHVLVQTWNPVLDGLLVPRVYKVVDFLGETERTVSSGNNGCEPVSANLRAFAHTDWMLVNLQHRRPERPTEMMKSMAGLYSEDLPFRPSLFTRAEHKNGVWASGGEWSDPVLFRANYSDIDFNGHVTQSAYIQWMMDAHAFDFSERRRLREQETIYAHELKPESSVQVRFRFEPDAAVFAREGVVVTYVVLNQESTVQHAWGRAVWI